MIIRPRLISEPCFRATGSPECCDGIGKRGDVGISAKDTFRASTLSLLGVSNSHVESDRAKIIQGESYRHSAVDGQEKRKVIIADGYHRLCAVYTFDENAMIPCKIAGPD